MNGTLVQPKETLKRETPSDFFQVIQLNALIFSCGLVCKEAARTEIVFYQEVFSVSLSGEPSGLQFIFSVPLPWASYLSPLLCFCGSKNLRHHSHNVNIKPISCTGSNPHVFLSDANLFSTLAVQSIKANAVQHFFREMPF